MKHRKSQAYQLQFKNGNTTEVYNTLKSIYAYHSVEEIGCAVDWLWKKKIGVGNPFENTKVKISLIQIKK